MRIGNLDGDVDPEIVNLGFSFVNKMVLLWFILSNNENLEEINVLPVLEKIQNTVRFWERFYLSLPGKISVYKCLLLSQISYKASVLIYIYIYLLTARGPKVFLQFFFYWYYRE
jgi:hypothetical protein